MTGDAPTVSLRKPASTELPSPFAGRYEVVRLLGEGGMGKVYQVLDRELREHVALKVVRGGTTPEAVRQLRDEVRLARRITHLNVVRIFDIAEHGGLHYFTMELVEGTTLGAALRDQALGLDRALRIASQIADGLTAAHVAGVVHRDLKPSNVLLSPDDRAVLTDFGIARPAAAPDSDEVSGTPGFMAPEQERGESSGVKSDVYSFALLANLMLGSGSTPLPAVLSAALARCLSLEPEARPLAAELAALFAQALAERATAGLGATRPAAQIAESLTEPSNEHAPLEKSIAVLPLKVLGGGLSAELAEALGAELVDALTRIRGLKVTSLGTTARFLEDRDPARVGRELKVGSAIDATLRRQGDRIRIDARLVEIPSGFQIWTARFEDELDGVLQLEEAMAGRIAEALRVGIGAVANRGVAPAESVELYLRARGAMHRYHLAGPEGALKLLEDCVARSPQFCPAHAALAHCRVRHWYSASGSQSARAEQDAKASIDRCLSRAPHLPESQIAAAMYQMQLGDYPAAVRGLRSALAAAPTCAEAVELLAHLELESGRYPQGMKRARLAVELDPTLVNARMQLLLREWMRSEAAFVEAEAAGQWRAWADLAPLLLARFRAAMWYRHPQAAMALAALVDSQADHIGDGMVPLFELCWEISQRRVSGDEAVARVDAYEQGWAMTPRRRAFERQALVEASCVGGDLGAASAHLARTAELPLLDLDWLQHCPALEPLRGSAAHREAMASVGARAEAIWR